MKEKTYTCHGQFSEGTVVNGINSFRNIFHVLCRSSCFCSDYIISSFAAKIHKHFFFFSEQILKIFHHFFFVFVTVIK